MMGRMMGPLTVAGLALTALMVASAPAQADYRGRPGGPYPPGGAYPEGRSHPYRSADEDQWRRGSWWQGRHDGRDGWWWITGNRWYWYSTPVYPAPSPYIPPQVATAPPGGAYYYCTAPAGYYPQVAACSQPWQMVSMQAAPAPMPSYSQAYSQTYVPPAAVTAAEPSSEKAVGGTILGGVGGAVAGAQFGKGTGQLAATAAGTLLGAFLGHEVGASLDRADFVAAQQAEQSARTAALGQTITWNNPASGTTGSLTPVRDGTDSSGHYCREYQQTVTVSGQPSTAYGTACRQPDGSWKLISQN